MKDLSLCYKLPFRHLFGFILFVLFYSCGSSDESQPPIPPEINFVTTLVNGESELVGQGIIGNTYTIHGKSFSKLLSVKFNGYGASFDASSAKDDQVMVTISEEAPYLDQVDKLSVATEDGTDEVDFLLLTIESIEEDVIDGIEVIYVNGGDFTSLDELILDPDDAVEGDEIITFPAEFIESRITFFKPQDIAEARIVIKTKLGAVIRSEKYVFY